MKSSTKKKLFALIFLMMFSCCFLYSQSPCGDCKGNKVFLVKCRRCGECYPSGYCPNGGYPLTVCVASNQVDKYIAMGFHAPCPYIAQKNNDKILKNSELKITSNADNRITARIYVLNP